MFAKMFIEKTVLMLARTVLLYSPVSNRADMLVQWFANPEVYQPQIKQKDYRCENDQSSSNDWISRLQLDSNTICFLTLAHKNWFNMGDDKK